MAYNLTSWFTEDKQRHIQYADFGDFRGKTTTTLSRPLFSNRAFNDGAGGVAIILLTNAGSQAWREWFGEDSSNLNTSATIPGTLLQTSQNYNKVAHLMHGMLWTSQEIEILDIIGFVTARNYNSGNIIDNGIFIVNVMSYDVDSSGSLSNGVLIAQKDNISVVSDKITTFRPSISNHIVEANKIILFMFADFGYVDGGKYANSTWNTRIKYNFI